ncbi:MAG: OmpA family protein [Bdellovibrionales bacterium]|nr:OmpA family protein [Bdellovibrionales bacterium]
MKGEEPKKVADTRRVLPESILSARKHAIKAGLFESKTLSRNLSKLDDSLRYEADLFTENLSAEKLSLFQSQYLDLEVAAVQNMQLGSFRGIIEKAENNDANNLAPKTLKTAKSDFNIAENLIRQSPRDSRGYEAEVEQANMSAKLLDDVMAKLQGDAKGSSEDVALTLVYQERKLGNLSDMVGDLQDSLTSTESELGTVSERLVRSQGRALDAENDVRFQKAMNEVRTHFAEEASVYRQGQELIIRLKKINFKSGDATIPTSAFPLLSKVSEIVGDLNTNEVVVEGHTDSAGKEGYNLILSNKRADAVKRYFSSIGVEYNIESKGLGEAKPIANNQTKQGRSLNRRVDIVVKASRN